MTHNKFYQIAISDPYSQDPAFLKAIEQDPNLAAEVERSKNLTTRLESVFEQPAADQGLKSSLLETANIPRKAKRSPAVIAIAASFFVAAVGLSFWQSDVALSTDLSRHALAHTKHRAGIAGMVNEQPTITSVNYRLKALGGQFKEQMKDIAWFNDCRFDGVDSLHLVFNGQQGKINVFMIAKDADFSFQPSFSNANYQGIAQELESAYVLIVGELDEPLKPFQETLSKSLSWNI